MNLKVKTLEIETVTAKYKYENVMLDESQEDRIVVSDGYKFTLFNFDKIIMYSLELEEEQ